LLSVSALRLAFQKPVTAALPALVIGGGVAGAAAATEIARRGRPVILVERQRRPHHKVCGEFISGEAALYLHDLGIDLAALGAVRIVEVRLCAVEQVIAARLPFPAFSLSRHVLDEALLRRAAHAGADVMRGSDVQSLRRQDGRWIIVRDDGHMTIAHDVFLASGKHDVRGWKRPPGRQNDLVAFKLHWRLTASETAALGASVELILFPGGYAGLEPIEDGIANLCLVLRKSRFATLGQRWDVLLPALLADCPHLARRLAKAEPCWPRPLAIASIPYGFVRTYADGLWHPGDQAACIPSFSGDGMSIALHSARLAALFCFGGGGPEAFQARLAGDIAAQVCGATLLSQMLVHPTGQKIGARAARLVPNLLGIAARATRIPSHRVNAVMDRSA
jgi:flavin-dependent dehydrogenase